MDYCLADRDGENGGTNNIVMKLCTAQIGPVTRKPLIVSGQ